MSYFLKSIFLLFYDIANLSNNLFIFPILIEYFLQFGIKINWINIGLIYSFYQIGNLLGNLLWNRLIYKFSSAILLLISLMLITIINFSLIFINCIEILMIQRFFLGLLNNLSFIQKNIFLELNKNKRQLFIINIFSYIISIFISVFNFDKYIKINYNNNKFIMNIIFLLLINIILLLLTFLLIKKNYIKIFSKKSYKISPKIEKFNKNKKNEKKVKKKINENKKKNIFTFQEETELSIEKSNRKFNNNNSINNKDESLTNIKYSHNNLNEESDFEKNKNFVEIVDNSNKNFVKNIFKKEKILSFILSLLNLLDYVFFIWIFIFLYFEFYNDSFKIGTNFLILNLFFLCLNFPLTNKIFSILKKNNDKKKINKISNIFIFIEIIIIIIINLDIIFYYFNIFENEKNKIILLNFLFVLRNLINSGLIQIYNIYIAMEFNYQTKNIRILNEFNKNINCFLKAIFSFFCAYAYYLFENTKNIDFNVNKLIFRFVLFFLIFPLFILITTLILVKNYLI